MSESEYERKSKLKRLEIKSKQIEESMWSKKIILGIIFCASAVIVIGFLTGFGR